MSPLLATSLRATFPDFARSGEIATNRDRFFLPQC
jgi:hypothetical protein